MKAIELRVLAQHTFGGDGLQNFIRDHQEELERLSHQVENLTTMTNKAVRRLQVGQERQQADLRMAEERQRLTAEQVGEWEGLVGEEYEDGETMEDVLRRVEARDAEVPRYPPVPGYDDPYVPDVQE